MSCLLEISSLAAPKFCYTSHKSTTLWTCFRKIQVKDFKTHCDIWGRGKGGFVFLHLAYNALLMGAWKTKESGRPHICTQVHKEFMFLNKYVNLILEKCILALWKHKSFLKRFATVEALMCLPKAPGSQCCLCLQQHTFWQCLWCLQPFSLLCQMSLLACTEQTRSWHYKENT